MKKIIYAMLMLMSVRGTLFAQETFQPARVIDRTFEINPEKITRRFWIDIGKGNRLRMELQNEDNLQYFLNMDSLLIVFLNDMKFFKDSLADPLPDYRIDYVIDIKGRKKIRILKFPVQGNSFLLDQGEPSSLKLGQDTINIILALPADPHAPSWGKGIQHARVSLYLNQYQEIENYITGGLNQKIAWLRDNPQAKWVHDGERGYHAERDISIRGEMKRGFLKAVAGGSYLSSAIYIDAGNYKNYFVPSFGLGMLAHFPGREANHIVGVLWEPNFFFEKDAKNALQTYRNDFLTLSYIRLEKRANFLKSNLNFNPTMSLGYLIGRQGDLVDRHSFRLTVGGLSFGKGDLILEPGIYFHDFFRGVTPSIRLNVNL